MVGFHFFPYKSFMVLLAFHNLKIRFSFCVCFSLVYSGCTIVAFFLCFLTNYYIVLKKRKEKLEEGVISWDILVLHPFLFLIKKKRKERL